MILIINFKLSSSSLNQIEPFELDVLSLTLEMLWGSNKPKSTSQNPSIVLVVSESYWRLLDVNKQDNELYLCQSRDQPPRYEIIYRSTKIYSLCRLVQLQTASDRFDRLKSIINVMFHSNPIKKASFITTILQKVIDTSIKYPQWLDVHISAFNGFVDFFQKANLSPDQINAQTRSEFYTPLHLAILGGFVETTKAIISFNPNIELLDSANNSILHRAVLSKADILGSILQLANIRKLFSRNKDHQNPIELACLNMKKDNLQRLMTFGLTARLLTLIVKQGQAIEEGQQEFLNKIDNETILKFTKSDMDQLDLTCINQGGCPLHWATSQAMIEKLLKAQFNIDTPNLLEETALNVMIKKNRHKIVLTLLYNGADANKADMSGATPLHIAVQKANVHLVRSLLVFDADVNATDGAGICVRHIAATGNNQSYPEIVNMLNALGARNCEPKQGVECSTGCVAKKITMPNSYEVPFNFNPKHKTLVSSIAQTTKDKSFNHSLSSNVKCPPNSKNVMLVSFDGGGIKGLLTVQMMIELSKYLRGKMSDYFDWIAGTSTGAVIAFLLAKGHSPTEIRKLYFKFKDQIMIGSRPYNSTKLKALFQGEFDANLQMGNMLSKLHKHLLIFATRVDCRPPSLQIFRSYSYPGANKDLNSMINCEAWRALLASTAAPTYFQSSPPYIDGGCLANNPTMDSLTEFIRYQSAMRKCNQRNHNKVVECQLKLVLSFGTGQLEPQIKSLSDIFNKLYCLHNLSSVARELTVALKIVPALIDQMKSLVTNCNEHIVSRADNLCAAKNVAFFRVNPVLSKKMPLNENDDTELIKGLWEVKVYAYQRSHQLSQIAHVIDCLHSSTH